MEYNNSMITFLLIALQVVYLPSPVMSPVPPVAPAVSMPLDMRVSKGFLFCPICLSLKLTSFVYPMASYFDKSGWSKPYPSLLIPGSTPAAGYYMPFICSNHHSFNLEYTCTNGLKAPDHYEYVPPAVPTSPTVSGQTILPPKP